jgi:thiol-disulfide isomerase/thioredoxin
MRTSTRWTIAGVTLVIVLIAALAVQLGQSPTPTARLHESVESTDRTADTPQALAEPRMRADLPACPTGAGNPGPKPLRGIVLECMGDGSPVDVARAVAGRAVVLNLWAYWCAPCAAELPAMAVYQQRVGPDVMVVTVHQDDNEAAGLQRLAALKVRLPALQDGQRRIAAALRVPNVMPATVVLRADGSVAKILPRAFASADEIDAAVGNPQR